MQILRNISKFTAKSSAAHKMYQTIAECYEGQSVFMTGGTGFLGKVILEKLLYSCHGIDKIYLLVREKHGETAEQRIQKIFEQSLFSRLKKEKPHAFEKIIPIVGDIAEPQLGMKAEDEELLADKVSTVLHVAATVKFNEPLKEAMNINVTGTERILNLSKRMKNIKAFVYVSTAYSNVDKNVIEEIIYPPPVPLDEVKKLLDSNISAEKIKELIKSRPNTYTFTKALAENLVADNHGSLPTVIIRPSIVGASQKEPIVGWIDNFFGATGLITTVMKGLNRVILGNSFNNLDIIPVDYVSNQIIVAAARCERSKQIKVYNSSTSSVNPISIKRVMGLSIDDNNKHKFYDIPMPMVFYSPFKWLTILMTLLVQTLPAHIADALLFITGKTPRYRKLQNRAKHIRDAVEYFTLNDWIITASRTRELLKTLSPADRYNFPFDPADIDWNKYMSSYCHGIRQHLYKI